MTLDVGIIQSVTVWLRIGSFEMDMVR